MPPIDVLRRCHPGRIGHATFRSDRGGSPCWVWVSHVFHAVPHLWNALSVLYGLLPDCSTAHRARGSGGSAPRPPRAVGQTSVYQHSLPCFPEATAFCGLLSPRSLPFLSLKVVALAAFCLLPSLRSTPSPTTLETLQVGFKTPSGCEATIHGAHQWFHRHRGDVPRVLTLPSWRPAASRTLLILWAILKARRVTDHASWASHNAQISCTRNYCDPLNTNTSSVRQDPALEAWGRRHDHFGRGRISEICQPSGNKPKVTDMSGKRSYTRWAQGAE